MKMSDRYFAIASLFHYLEMRGVEGCSVTLNGESIELPEEIYQEAQTLSTAQHLLDNLKALGCEIYRFNGEGYVDETDLADLLQG